MGCSRSQVTLALEQAAVLAVDPEKLGLLWAAEWLTQRRDEEALRQSFRDVLTHPLGRAAYPRYLSGFLQALGFAPRLAPLGVELLGRAFESLPDHVLLPWIPGLLSALEARKSDVLPGLFREALGQLPRSANELAGWVAPWEAVRVEIAETPGDLSGACGILRAFPAATEAWAGVLGIPTAWAAERPSPLPRSDAGLPAKTDPPGT